MKLNVKDDEAKRAAEQLGVKGPTTLIHFDADGKEMARFKGFRPPAEFLAFLDEVEKPAKATDKAPENVPEKSTNRAPVEGLRRTRGSRIAGGPASSRAARNLVIR